MIRRVLVAALLLAAAGCSGDSSMGNSGADGLGGRNVLVDDTGLGDVEDPGGWILVLPADRAPELWAEVGEPTDLSRALFSIDAAMAEEVGGTLAEVDRDGNYAIAASGPALLCRVPERGSTRGCAEIDLPESGTVLTSFGEGGFQATIDG